MIANVGRCDNHNRHYHHHHRHYDNHVNNQNHQHLLLILRHHHHLRNRHRQRHHHIRHRHIKEQQQQTRHNRSQVKRLQVPRTFNSLGVHRSKENGVTSIIAPSNSQTPLRMNFTACLATLSYRASRRWYQITKTKRDSRSPSHLRVFAARAVFTRTTGVVRYFNDDTLSTVSTRSNANPLILDRISRSISFHVFYTVLITALIYVDFCLAPTPV